VTDQEATLRAGGEIADLAPTVLQMLGIDQPSDMSGEALVKRR